MADQVWPMADAAGNNGHGACVEYVGRTALVVTGPYTGARYRFLQPGARVTVDARDRQAMLSIPMLRAVSAMG
jgi:hypothetical protein